MIGIGRPPGPRSSARWSCVVVAVQHQVGAGARQHRRQRGAVAQVAVLAVLVQHRRVVDRARRASCRASSGAASTASSRASCASPISPHAPRSPVATELDTPTSASSSRSCTYGIVGALAASARGRSLVMYGANSRSNARDATTVSHVRVVVAGDDADRRRLQPAAVDPRQRRAPLARQRHVREIAGQRQVIGRLRAQVQRAAPRAAPSCACATRLTTRFSAPTARLSDEVGRAGAREPAEVRIGDVREQERRAARQGVAWRLRGLRDHLHVGDDAEVIRREHARARRLRPRGSSSTMRAPRTVPRRSRRTGVDEDVVQAAIGRQPVHPVDVGLARAQVTPVALAAVRMRVPRVLVRDPAPVQRRHARRASGSRRLRGRR